MSNVVTALRWVALLPAAIAAAWLGYFLMALAWNISLSMQGIDLNDFFVRICHFAASGMAMGGAFVYGGAYVAPSHKTHTAIILAILVALVLGTAVPYVIVGGIDQYWGAWQGVCALMGAGAAAIAIATEGFRNPLF